MRPRRFENDLDGVFYAESKPGYVPQALYHVGLLSADAEKPEEALAALQELIQKYPDSPWTGDAQVWLIDVKLEHQFDLPGAKLLAESAVAWNEHLDKTKAAQARKGLGDDQSDALRSLQQVGYEIYVRAGLVEYLLERPERAVGFFEKAKPLAPARNFVEVNGHVPTGMERLIGAAKSGKQLTPEVVRNGDEKAKMILMLADVYYEGQEHPKSVDLCTRVIEGVAPKASREQKSYAYFRRGRSRFEIWPSGFDPDAQLKDYVAAVAAAPNAPWADQAMVKGGLILWNYKHNAEAAISAWQRVIRFYPKSAEGDRCACFIGLTYHARKRYREAKQAFDALIAKYPESEFVPVAKNMLDDCNAQLKKSGERSQK